MTSAMEGGAATSGSTPFAPGSTAVTLALLPSPLLGPAVWQPVADRLRARGWSVVPPTTAGTTPRSAQDVLGAFLAALPEDRDLALIAHSNAGLYVPALSAERRVRAYVFVDARLPAGEGTVPLAPPAFVDLLALQADQDGLLPPWTQWWDEPDVSPLFPTPEVRERVEREQPRLPLSYFSESLPVPAAWDRRPGAYIAFGDTYGPERDAAARRGWPVTTMSGSHLHLLVAPDDVADEIDTLLTTIGARPLEEQAVDP